MLMQPKIRTKVPSKRSGRLLLPAMLAHLHIKCKVIAKASLNPISKTKLDQTRTKHDKCNKKRNKTIVNRHGKRAKKLLNNNLLRLSKNHSKHQLEIKQHSSLVLSSISNLKHQRIKLSPSKQDQMIKLPNVLKMLKIISQRSNHKLQPNLNHHIKLKLIGSQKPRQLNPPRPKRNLRHRRKKRPSKQNLMIKRLDNLKIVQIISK